MKVNYGFAVFHPDNIRNQKRPVFCHAFYTWQFNGDRFADARDRWPMLFLANHQFATTCEADCNHAVILPPHFRRFKP